jgi:hypothetical protein
MACSHEQCRRVPDRKTGRGEIVLPADPRTLMRSLPSPPISRSCAARRIRKIWSAGRGFGLTGIGIADRNSVAGVVRAYRRRADSTRKSGAE